MEQIHERIDDEKSTYSDIFFIPETYSSPLSCYSRSEVSTKNLRKFISLHRKQFLLLVDWLFISLNVKFTSNIILKKKKLKNIFCKIDYLCQFQSFFMCYVCMHVLWYFLYRENIFTPSRIQLYKFKNP